MPNDVFCAETKGADTNNMSAKVNSLIFMVQLIFSEYLLI